MEWRGLRGRETRRIEARFAGDDVYLIDRGNDDGARLIDPPTGQPLLGVSGACLPEHAVFDRASSHWWSRVEGHGGLALYDTIGKTFEFYDARSFGLTPFAVQDQTPLEFLERLKKCDGEWTTTESNGLVRVCVEELIGDPKDHRGFRYTWTIDPRRDYAILETTKTELHGKHNERPLARAVCDYVQMDGRWWPSKVHCLPTAAGYESLVEYEHAEFDKPDHPKTLLPESMGVPVGIMVASTKRSLADVGVWQGRYLGNGQLATDEEWEKIKDNYDLAPLRAFWQEQFKHWGGSYPQWWDSPDYVVEGETIRWNPDAWEVYVRRWIMKRTATPSRKLDCPLESKQIVAAWSVLKECREQARPIVEKREADLKRVAKTIADMDPGRVVQQALNSQRSGPKVDDLIAKLVAAHAEREALSKPDSRISAIFEELKARLEELQDSRQRFLFSSRPTPVAVSPTTDSHTRAGPANKGK